MHPIVLKIGPLVVYSYGVMVAIGFSVFSVFTYRNASKFGIDKDNAIDLSIIILMSGIIGARLLYVLLNLKYYLADPLEILMLAKGGLVWYGGFIFALAGVSAYIYFNKLKLSSVADLIAPYLALAQGFGRIGCFFNGCCYGINVAAGFPSAVTFPGDSGARLPIQLISAAILFLIAAILVIWQNRRRFAGEVFLAYCVLYSVKRFGVEFFRADNSRIALGLTMSQLISVAIFIIAFSAFIIKAGQWKKRLTASK